MLGLVSKRQVYEEPKVRAQKRVYPVAEHFQVWLETHAAKGGMSASCRHYTVMAAELVETYEELGFDDENVRREAKGDITRVARRRKMSANRECVPTWSVPTEVLMSRSPGSFSVRYQERRGVGCLEIKAAKYRLFWQPWRVHIHVRREEKGTGLTPTIAHLSAGHVDKHNREAGLAALRLHLFCAWLRNVLGLHWKKEWRNRNRYGLNGCAGT